MSDVILDNGGKQYISVYRHFGKVYESFKYHGKKFVQPVENFEYEFFIQDSKNHSGFVDVETQQKRLRRLTFNTPKEMSDKLRQLKDVGYEPFNTVSPENQYRFKEYYSNKDIEPLHMGLFDIETGFNGSFLDDDGNLIFGDGRFPKPENVNSSIVSCVLCSNKNKMYYVFGVKDYTPKRKDVRYRKCTSEKDVIESFFKTVNILEIDVLSAWNAEGFDFPYFVGRMRKLGMDLKLIDKHLSNVRDANVLEKSFEKPKSYHWVDYMLLYKKFIFTPRERYSLDFIAKAELGEGKLDYLKDERNLEELYNEDFETFIDYNIRDVEIMVELDEKLQLLGLGSQLMYLSNVNYTEVFGTIQPWGQKVYCESYLKGMCLPRDFRESNVRKDFEGGWVSVKPGFYEWVMSFDFASLYPSIIRAFNLCPSKLIPDDELHPELKEIQQKYFSDRNAEYETITKFMNTMKTDGDLIQSVLDKHKVTVTMTGDFFSVDGIGFMPDIYESIYQDRKKAKKIMQKHERNVSELEVRLENGENVEKELSEERSLVARYNNEQQALKIFLNSGFGASGNHMFVLYNEQIARSITACGRLYDRYCSSFVRDKLTEKFNPSFDPVVQSDTDSFYISISYIIDKLRKEGKLSEDVIETTDYIIEHIEPIIQKMNQSALDELNFVLNVIRPEVLELDREIISSSFINNGKKNYSANVIDSEGTRYIHGKLKIVGLALKKTNIPEFVRKELHEMLKIILTGEESEFQERFKEYKSHYYQIPVDDIAFPKGCNIFSETKGREYFLGEPGVPIHVRAALLYNSYIDRHDLGLKKIETGDKIKFLYMKTPNPIGDNVIGYPNDKEFVNFIEEQGLKRFVDYDISFEKNVRSPLKDLIKNRRWTFERENKLF